MNYPRLTNVGDRKSVLFKFFALCYGSSYLWICMADKILIFRACLEQKICFKPYIGQPEDAIRTLPGGVSHFPFSVYYYYCASFVVRYEVSSTSRHTNHE